MSSFESIFASNTNTKSDLDALFKKAKSKPNPKSHSILEAIDNAQINGEVKTDEATTSTSAKTTVAVKPTSASSRTRRDRNKVQKFTDETESRTLFIGNLPNTTKKEDLLKIFKGFGKIESVRFRNIVPEDVTKSKKFAFITHQHHPSKQTINAFLRFETQENATNALSLNGSEFKSHHIRVDLANKSKVHDNKRSIFLGGLSFSITEEAIHKHFKECGEIENVRLIRDNKTGVGKGIGYVTFKTADSINLALKLNTSEIENRKVRVERCSKKQKKKKGENKAKNNEKNGKNNRKPGANNTKGSANADRNGKKSERPKREFKTNPRDKKVGGTNKTKKKSGVHKNPLKSIKTNKKPSSTFKF